jgi:DNA-binding transcriptional ArsR family regulator
MDDATLVDVFKALSNDNRLRIFKEIRDEGHASFEDGCGCFLNNIIDHLKIGAPTVSHHLKQLVNAGLVVTEKRGKFVHCRLDGSGLEAVGAFFDDARRVLASTDDDS